MRLTQSVWKLSLLALLLLGLSACGSAKIGLDKVPVPPEATHEPFEGGFEVRLDINDSEIRDMLQGKYYSSAEADIWTLPDTAAWEDVAAFYTTALEKDGWTPDDALNKLEHSHFQSRVWSRSTGGTARQAIVVAFVPKGEDEMPNNFLMLFVTR